jgi:multiple sugar transport system ATP-binding protein
MASITLSHLVKRHAPGGPAAVDDVSLAIEDGELVVLVGPSGCGKSTVLRMIAGLDDITEGELRIDGERANEQGPRERGLAMVFQSYALYPHLTVHENIAFPLRVARRLGEEEIRRRVGEVAALLELGELLDRKPGQLSGGQRQRVAMGRAIVREARGFLFDEPLSNLDAKLRAQMRIEIARLQRRLGATMVYVTHDQVEAMTLGQRVAVLRRGKLQQVDRPRDLYDRPVNLFVAGFIGSPAMNLVPARVEEGGVSLPFANVALPPEVLRRVPPHAHLVAGIRPEHFEDAALVPPEVRARGTTIEAAVDATEWLGSEQLAYVPYEPTGEAAATIRRLTRELEAEGLRTQLVVSLDGASSIRGGATARLWLDTRRMHLFDPRTGENLTRDADAPAGGEAGSPDGG